MSKLVIAIVGPTASGKSRLAHTLAQSLKTEIISADSRLVYKGLEIGTAKPSQAEMAELPYHMVDVTLPNCEYSLGKYLAEAKPILQNLLQGGTIPLVVGGTGFYLRGLLENLNLPEVKPDFDFRKSLEAISTAELYSELKATDNQDRWKMHPNDRPRIVRALELTKAGLYQSEPAEQDFEVLWLGLNYNDRDKLRQRIKERTEQMLSAGLIAETKELLAKYGRLELFERTIGYCEALEYLEGRIESEELLSAAISLATAQYAKRQLTWFRRNKSIIWLNSADNLNHLVDSCLEKIESIHQNTR